MQERLQPDTPEDTEPAERTVSGRNQVLLRLYGLGILIALFGMYWFYVGMYGQGGVPERRGESPRTDRHFPKGADYILVNGSDVTVISAEYYRLVRQAERVSEVAIVLALPFLLAGLCVYRRRVAAGSRDRMARLWVLLFIPLPGDPAITRFAKLAFLLGFAGLILFGFADISVCSEAEFLKRLRIAYAAIAGVSVLGAWALGRLRGEARGDEAAGQSSSGPLPD